MSTYFTADHEWIKVDGDTAVVGITSHAAEQLGELVFIELSAVGATFEKGSEMGVLESVKAASEVYAPVDCTILEANSTIEDTPNLVNDDPENRAWMYKVSLKDKSQLNALMDEATYKAGL